MNINKYQHIALFTLLLAAGCKQDVIKLQEAPTAVTPTYTNGKANFSKYVAVGNSLTAGYQAGALFTLGQQNSFPLIMNKSFQSVGGSTTFNQPDINSVNGYSSFDAVNNVVLGRFVLFAVDDSVKNAVPTASGSPWVPAPYNTGDVPGPYAGDKTKLNNFGVPGILLGQVLIPQTGDPTPGNPYFNPLYYRFASNPGTSTIIGDAIAAQPTFFSFDLGNNDVLGYATSGGDKSIVPLTDPVAFQGYYNSAIGALLNPLTNPNSPNGVVSTIPDVESLPFFHAVAYNIVKLKGVVAAEITTSFANNYNAFLQGMVMAGALTASEATQRTVTYASGKNAILITDSDLTNLAPYMQGPYAGLLPYAKARQATATDLVTLTAGGVIGTVPAGADASVIYGVTFPLPDKYVLVPSEIDSIETYTTAYNKAITAIAAQYPGRIAVADVYTAFRTLLTNGAYVANGVTIVPSFAPPLGGFSEDGIHPNSRGYAFLASIFISAIEAEFTAVIPQPSLADYAPVGLPLVK